MVQCGGVNSAGGEPPAGLGRNSENPRLRQKSDGILLTDELFPFLRNGQRGFSLQINS